MSTTVAALRPAPAARELRGSMLEGDGARDVQRTILEETLRSAEHGSVKEAGRTLCGSMADIRGPAARYPTAVGLVSCPVNAGVGLWHTHVTREEFRNPTHSLPDLGNVVFEGADVSIVVGTQSLEAVIAGDDRAAMVSAFQDALGLPVESKDELIAAVRTGAVGDEDRALERVTTTLDPLVDRQPTNFPDLDARTVALPGSIAELSGMMAHGHALGACQADVPVVSPDAAGLRRQAREGGELLTRGVDRFAKKALDEAVGLLAANLVSDYLLRRSGRR